MSTPYTMDSLSEMFRMQKELAAMMGPDRYPPGTDTRIQGLCTAIIHEAVELQRHTAWKWWKKPVPMDMKKAREELADIWHFVIQASIELDMTPQDILAEYRRKNDINIKRQQTGY